MSWKGCIIWGVVMSLTIFAMGIFFLLHYPDRLTEDTALAFLKFSTLIGFAWAIGAKVLLWEPKEPKK